jgi:hypothetical protein
MSKNDLKILSERNKMSSSHDFRFPLFCLNSIASELFVYFLYVANKTRSRFSTQKEHSIYYNLVRNARMKIKRRCGSGER